MQEQQKTNKEKLIRLLEKNLEGAEIEIKALVDDDNHYQLIVKSKDFSGKSKVAQHKMVLGALEGLMDKDLHALSIKTVAI